MNTKPLNITHAEKDTPTINKWANQTDANIRKLQNQQATTTKTVSTVMTTITSGTSTTPAPPVASMMASQNGNTIDGVLKSIVTLTYTAPNPLGTFAGVFFGISGYHGSSVIVKQNEDNYTGAPGGSHSFNTTLDRTGETVTIYAIQKNLLEAGPANWATAPHANVVLDGSASAPTAPTGVTALQQALTVTLQWNENAETNMLAYNVYRNTTNTPGAATKIGNVAFTGNGSPSFVDNNITVSTTYFYWVTAVDRAQLESVKSTVTSNNAAAVNLDTQVGDGSTFYRTTLNEKTGGGRGFVAINVNNKMASLITQQPVGAPGDFPGSTNPLSQPSGTSPSINVAAFSIIFGSNTIAFNSGSTNPGTYGTWYVYFDDPTYSGGAQTYHATANTQTLISNDGRIYIGSINTVFHAPIVWGSGGGSGGGIIRFCFSGNTLVMTKRGDVAIKDVLVGDFVLTGAATWRQVTKVIIHEASQSTMLNIGGNELVTLDHLFMDENFDWKPAAELFEGHAQQYWGELFNLEIDGTSFDEHSYALACGLIAHNSKNQY